jgi:hypothetical protein
MRALKHILKNLLALFNSDLPQLSDFGRLLPGRGMPCEEQARSCARVAAFEVSVAT